MTTLSTIGFGDFMPVSNAEKILMIFCFILGIAVFTIMLGNFSDSLLRIIEISKDYEDTDTLA